MATPTPIIARDVRRRFGATVALNGVSLDVRAGEMFGVIGPDGAGKTTFLRTVCGLESVDGGDVSVFGVDPRRDRRLVTSAVGYLSQQFSLYGDLSVRENLEFYGRIYGLSEERLAERMQDVLSLTGMHDRIDQLAETLSGGWKQRLALACALIHEPDVVFLDEPTAGIDPVARRQLWDLLFELSGRGVTLFVTTHYMDEAERCTDVGYIYMSRLLVLGRPSDLKELPEVTPEGTVRYEIEVPEAARSLPALRAVLGVRDATLFGDAIHTLVDASVPQDKLLAPLAVPRDSVQVTPIEPTLEDVFVTLTRVADQERESGKTAPTRRLSPEPPPLSPSESSPGEPKPADDRHDEKERRPERAETSPGADALWGFWAILVKEFYHIRRQPATLFFALVVPAMQTLIFGIAIDTQIENIPLAVYNLDGRAESRRLIEAFVNTRRFKLVADVHDEDSFNRSLTSGRAKAGLKIPPNLSDRLVRGEKVEVQVLIDGSDSQVATTALNASQLLGINLSLQIAAEGNNGAQLVPARDEAGNRTLPLEVRPRLLFNPDLKSANFFVPGLVGTIMQLVTLFLTAFAIVREREVGTLEQLFVTPVGSVGLLLGKLVPYALLGFLEMLIVLSVMVWVFDVPINGNLGLLLGLSTLFLICALGMGLLVSTLAHTQLAAIQYAFVIMMPSILLSGFMFPRSEMPAFIQPVTYLIPVTYFLEVLRGIVLRGADLRDLSGQVVGMVICCLAILAIAVGRFRKQLG